MTGQLPHVTVGAGGVLVRDEGVLLVRTTYGPSRGRWTIPGGFQEAGETVAEAVEREVLEETGVRGRVSRLLIVRSIASSNHSDTYLAFALEDLGGDARADGVEVAEATFKPLAWALEAPEVSALSRAVLGQARAAGGLVPIKFLPSPPRTDLRAYVVYAPRP